MDIHMQVLFTGTGATALMDVAMVARERFLRIPQPDYGLVGRWIGRFPNGQFVHSRIAAAPAVKGERAIGWAAHYAIGIAFAEAGDTGDRLIARADADMYSGKSRR